jgi:hypothetical protein
MLRVTPSILKYFAFGHLPPHLQEVSRPIGELADTMTRELPPGPELSAGLRKLLEAKDCFVRAALERVPKTNAEPSPASVAEHNELLKTVGA